MFGNQYRLLRLFGCWFVYMGRGSWLHSYPPMLCCPIKSYYPMKLLCDVKLQNEVQKTEKKHGRIKGTRQYAAQDCPCLQFLGPGKRVWFRLAKRSRHLGLPCFALRLGLWRWYQWLWCCQNFGMHFVSSFGPSTYHTARYTIQGCDCMSMQQLSRNNFSMLLPTFFHFLGHHFWVPFLGPIFGAPYHFKRKFDWSQRW